MINDLNIKMINNVIRVNAILYAITLNFSIESILEAKYILVLMKAVPKQCRNGGEQWSGGVVLAQLFSASGVCMA